MGLVSMASRDLRRSGYNKQGRVSTNATANIARTHQEPFECIPMSVVTISPLFAAKNVERRSFERRRLERGLGLEEALVGVASDRIS